MKINNLKLKARALMLSSMVLVPLSACGEKTSIDEVAYVDSIETTDSKLGTEDVSETLTTKTEIDTTKGYTEAELTDKETTYTDSVLTDGSIYTYVVANNKTTETTTKPLTTSKSNTTKNVTKSEPVSTTVRSGKVTKAEVPTDTTKKSTTVTSTTKNSGSDTTKTTTKTTEKTTPTTKKTTTTTTKKTTTTTTTKKTTTTPKPTETTTTTTVTEPPVITYTINDICYNADAFNYFADLLATDLRTAPNGGQYLSVSTPYGHSSGVNEAKFILALLNNGAISADVLSKCLSDISGNFLTYSSFVTSFASYQMATGRTYNFSAYTCDNCRYVGDYINNIEVNYINGTYPAFFTDQITNNNINPQVYGNIAVRMFFWAYDLNYFMFTSYDAGSDIYNYVSNLRAIVNGRSYTY